MNYKKIEKELNDIAPLSLQEEWDNSGWQINLNNPDIKRVLVALDITDAVIDEAIEEKCQLIVTHHPMYFNPLKLVDSNEIYGNYTVRLIGAGISVYSSHTPFDIVKGGNNDYLGKLLEISDIDTLKGDKTFITRKGHFEGSCTISQIIDKCESVFGVSKQFFSLIGNPDTIVKKVAWCTGAGSEFIELAKYDDCDLFITGDLKYHQALDAKAEGMNVLDIGHYASEITFVDNMGKKLKKIDALEIVKSKACKNPFSAI